MNERTAIEEIRAILDEKFHPVAEQVDPSLSAQLEYDKVKGLAPHMRRTWKKVTAADVRAAHLGMYEWLRPPRPYGQDLEQRIIDTYHYMGDTLAARAWQVHDDAVADAAQEYWWPEDGHPGLRDLQAAAAALRTGTQTLTTYRDEAVYGAAAAGIPISRIADAAGVTRQTVYRIIQSVKDREDQS